MLNWFPGHMLTAQRQIKRVLKRVDVVLEVRDARIPLSSSSPLLRETIGPHMPVLVVLNKADLANANLSHKAVRVLGPDSTVLVSAGGPARGKGVAHLLPHCERLTKASRTRGPLHVLVVGVPNSGKSSLINALRGRGHSARTGATPGLTRNVGTFQVTAPSGAPVYVVDSPGILSPAYSLEEWQGKHLAICGAVKDTAVSNEQVHEWLLQVLEARGRDIAPLKLEHLIQKTGGALDRESAALAVLNDFRAGNLGRMTLDKM